MFLLYTYLNRVNGHCGAFRQYLRVHVEGECAVLRQSVTQVEQFVIQALLETQNLDLLYGWVVELVAYLK